MLLTKIKEFFSTVFSTIISLIRFTPVILRAILFGLEKILFDKLEVIDCTLILTHNRVDNEKLKFIEDLNNKLYKGEVDTYEDLGDIEDS